MNDQLTDDSSGSNGPEYQLSAEGTHSADRNLEADDRASVDGSPDGSDCASTGSLQSRDDERDDIQSGQDRALLDPRLDPSWKPTTYRYRNASLEVVATTQEPLDDEAALAYFHRIVRWGPGFRDVTYIEKAPPETSRDPQFQMLPYKFVEGEVCPLQS